MVCKSQTRRATVPRRRAVTATAPPAQTPEPSARDTTDASGCKSSVGARLRPRPAARWERLSRAGGDRRMEPGEPGDRGRRVANRRAGDPSAGMTGWRARAAGNHPERQRRGIYRSPARSVRLCARREATVHRARQADSERLHRELQQPLARGVS